MKKRIGLICLLLCVMLASTAFAACEKDEDHRYGPWKTKTTATCTRQGHQFKYCTRCDHWEQRYTAKLPHTPGEMTVTKAATCTETGKQEAVCQVCGNTVRYTIDKLPHAYGEMTVVQEPTCVKAGKGEYVCAGCGRKKTETLPKLGHEWGEERVVKEPTCKSQGTGEETCTRCAKVQSTKIGRLDHVYSDWDVTREPEGKRKGIRKSECTLCGQSVEEYFYHEGTLYQDMEPCEEVIALQEMLRDLGYYNGSIRSGQFGKLTTTAVARFQEDNDMEGSGVADAATLDCLEAAWEAAMGKTADKTVNTLAPEVMENAEDAKTI